MGQVVKLGAGQALTEKQRAFVDAILGGASNKDAATLAGYSEGTLPAEILASAAVQAAIRARCDARLQGELRAKALKTLDDILDTGPPATKFNAAKLILEWGEDEREGDKPLSAMSETELMAVIERAEKVREDARRGRIIDVTPGNGAHPQPS